MKPFKSLEEQIDILKQRNLKFKKEEYAMDYLLHNNYYNVVNCYSKYFIENDIYINNTYFEDIINVHHFDKEVKSMFFKYIIEAERTFKSILAHRYSEYYQDLRYSYLYIGNYNDNNILDAAKFISQLSSIITSKTNEKNNSISHYVNKYDNVPMWVLINFLTFGQVSKLYSYLHPKLQNTIAKDLSKRMEKNLNVNNIMLTQAQLSSYLINLVEFRNLIAHNNKILGHKCKKHNKYNQYLHSYYQISNNHPRNDIYNVFITLNVFLSCDEYCQLNNGISKRMSKLKKSVNSDIPKKIIKDLGFPFDLPKKQQ